jgi:hypothetical protein
MYNNAMSYLLFNSNGEWVAIQDDHNVYSRSGKYMGWISDDIVISTSNQYLGTIIKLVRLYYLEDHPVFKENMTLILKPPYAGPIKGHGNIDREELPSGARDVVI